jgi:hypothetical protein
MIPDDVRGRWSAAFADPTGAAFADVTHPAVFLEGSVFAQRVCGRAAVWTTLRAASGIYQGLAFGTAGTGPGRVYLEWSATALDLDIAGVTVLAVTGDGRVTGVAIHHRPLEALLEFSAELGRRLTSTTTAGELNR